MAISCVRSVMSSGSEFARRMVSTSNVQPYQIRAVVARARAGRRESNHGFTRPGASQASCAAPLQSSGGIDLSTMVTICMPRVPSAALLNAIAPP